MPSSSSLLGTVVLCGSSLEDKLFIVKMFTL